MTPATITRPHTDHIALVFTPSGDVEPLANPVNTAIPQVLGHTRRDVISLTPSVDLWYDQYAALSARPVNPLAITIATSLTGIPTTICGPALIASHTDSGTFIGLSPGDLADFMAWYATVTNRCRHYRDGVAL